MPRLDSTPEVQSAWTHLPQALSGRGQPLPSWAQRLAPTLPRTTAALLQLDHAHRTANPLDPALRAAMRFVVARANRCTYGEAYAVADARRAGLDSARIEALGQAGYPGWSESDGLALHFAQAMTVDSDAVTDAEFADLVQRFGANLAAAMVLLLAYANFQDRMLICLRAPIEPGGPLAPLNVTFDPATFITRTTPPPNTDPANRAELPLGSHSGEEDSRDDPIHESLQDRLEAQRRKPTRLRIPAWDEVARNLPPGLIDEPSDIVWYRIVFGYAPELAVPFEVFMRTAGAEAGPRWDRVFAQGLFWVTTQAVKCPYCMGHCEMNWEVAGLNTAEIAERSRRLGGGDWSSFPVVEQHAYGFARKLAEAPGMVSDADLALLDHDLGPDLALLVILNTSRYHYMTRISNGFQLTLERENVFYDYYKAHRP